MKLVAIVGKKRSGKDTLADYINSKYETKKIQLAGPIKDILAEAYCQTKKPYMAELTRYDWEGKGIDREKGLVINNLDAENLIHKCLELASRRYNLKNDISSYDRMEHFFKNNVLNNTDVWTMRRFMQTLGTDVVVDNIDRMFWVKIAINEYLDYFGSESQPEMVIIPDVRQTFELDSLRAMGATIIHVVRPGLEIEDQHITEAGLPIHFKDTIIKNEGSLEDFYENINKVL